MIDEFCVDLRGGQLGVPEGFLDGFNSYTAREACAGVCVSPDMGGDVLVYAGQPGDFGEVNVVFLV